MSSRKTCWLLETDVFSENLGRIVDEVKAQGMEVRLASGAPNGDYLSLFDKNDCVVYYGSLNFALQVRREAPWIPGVYHNKPAFTCTSYYPALGKWLLNSDYIMIPYGDIIRQEEFLYNQLGEDSCIFIRPNTGSKIFTGKLIAKERFEKEVKYLGFYGAQPDELCVVSRPRNIETEWRFVVVEGRVITGSQYFNDGKAESKAGWSPEAFSLAEEVAASGYSPDPVWCLDICRTKAGNYYLLEIGCFSCSGLYDCNLQIVVREVSRIALAEWKDINE